MIRVFLVDDHTVVRQGLRLILEDATDMTVVGEAATAQEALHRVPAAQPDVILLDIHLPDQSGVAIARDLHRLVPTTRILILTVSDRHDDVFEALQAGARGYILKSASADEVIAAIRQVMSGGVVLPPDVAARLVEDLTQETTAGSPTQEPLTAREREVLRYLAGGLSNKEIAHQLGISENTVKSHVRHILAKLNVRSRVEAATYAVRMGLVPERESSPRFRDTVT